MTNWKQFEDGATVDAAALIEAGLVPDTKLPVKILGDGALSKKLTVVAGWYSKSAFEKITAAGGTAQNAKGEPFEFPKPKKKFVPREGGKQGKKRQARQRQKARSPKAQAAAAAEAARAPKQPKQEDDSGRACRSTDAVRTPGAR